MKGKKDASVKVIKQYLYNQYYLFIFLKHYFKRINKMAEIKVLLKETGGKTRKLRLKHHV